MEYVGVFPGLGVARLSRDEFDVGAGATLVAMGMEDECVESVDAELIDTEGARWSATVLTLAEIDRLTRIRRSTGECFGGAYFRVPDLLIVDEPTLRGPRGLLAVVQELVRTGDYQSAFAAIEEE